MSKNVSEIISPMFRFGTFCFSSFSEICRKNSDVSFEAENEIKGHLFKIILEMSISDIFVELWRMLDKFFPYGHLSLKIHNVEFYITVSPGKMYVET